MGVPLYGSIDCVLRSSKGEAIVDFKLGGGRKFEEKLATGRAVQLATYAHSRQEAGQTVHAGAYFVLTTSRLITPAGGAIPAAAKVVSGPSIVESWSRFSQALRLGNSWMDEGRIPARPLQDPTDWDPGTNAALDSEAAEHPVCDYCDYPALCGLRRLA